MNKNGGGDGIGDGPIINLDKLEQVDNRQKPGDFVQNQDDPIQDLEMAGASIQEEKNSRKRSNIQRNSFSEGILNQLQYERLALDP